MVSHLAQGSQVSFSNTIYCGKSHFCFFLFRLEEFYFFELAYRLHAHQYWIARNSCVLTIFLELVMLSISVSGSIECAGCAYEATDDFTIFFAKFFFANFILGDWLKTSLPITCTSILDRKKCTPTTIFCKSSMFARNIKKNRNWQGSLRRLVANQKTKFLFLSKPSGNVTI